MRVPAATPLQLQSYLSLWYCCWALTGSHTVQWQLATLIGLRYWVCLKGQAQDYSFHTIKWRYLIVLWSRLYVGILHNLQSFFDSRLAAMSLYKVYNLELFVPNVTTMYIIICIMYYTVSDPYYSYVWMIYVYCLVKTWNKHTDRQTDIHTYILKWTRVMFII